MHNFILRLVSLCMIIVTVVSLTLFDGSADGTALTVSASVESPELGITAKSCILMEKSSGQVLYEKNADEALPPASVTKIMTLLLVMEAIDGGKISLTDTVSASADACSMGGSQIYLKENETMTVDDLLKSVVIASANDAAYALAEYVAGSETAFVGIMNKRAAELGMKNTNFENTNGLDDTTVNHVTSARDIAIMSRELISHPKVLEYSSTWMDTVRNGTFGLTNTNRLVRFYRGCNGLKTGSTSKAGFCVSVTAERDGMTLICVIMGAETRDIRNSEAAKLLDWGFANYALYKNSAGDAGKIPVAGSANKQISAVYPEFSCVVKKGELNGVSMKINLPESVSAPVKAGDSVGNVTFELDGKTLGDVTISSSDSAEKMSFSDLLEYLFARLLLI